MVENMPSGDAIRPGDVLTFRNGKTAEVLNTDAEGRLILADALALAAEAKPDGIVDLATLTGACVVALGEKIAGLMANDEAFGDRVRGRGRSGPVSACGRSRCPKEYRKMLDSEIADMKNISHGGYGGALTAGLFLQEFVNDVPWVHLDIAGPARAGADDGYTRRGGTGFGVRTLLELVSAPGTEGSLTVRRWGRLLGTTVAVAAAIVVGLAGVAAADDYGNAPVVTVRMTDNVFAPQTVVVDPGTVVRWVNVGRNKHNVVVDVKSAAWTSSKSIKAGKDYDHQFDEPGVYGYSCSFHGAAAPADVRHGDRAQRRRHGAGGGDRAGAEAARRRRPHDPRAQGPEDDPVGGRPRRARRPDPDLARRVPRGGVGDHRRPRAPRAPTATA